MNQAYYFSTVDNYNRVHVLYSKLINILLVFEVGETIQFKCGMFTRLQYSITFLSNPTLQRLLSWL